MSVFKFSDYDCIGFDLDHTLLQYNVTNLVKMEYESLAKYLVNKKGYNSKYLLKPLEDKDYDFMQKGLAIDFERGNILRISPDGVIQRACHGSKLLNIEEIKEIYPNQRWEVIDAFCKDVLSTWNGPLSMKMRCILDYFEIPSPLIFAKVVDTLDEENGGPLNIYNIWPDMLEGLYCMYHRDSFKSHEGHFFTNLKSNPDKYLRKCSADTISWIKKVKKNCTTFLITGSYADFVDFTAGYALGKDWKSLFDIVVCFAKKPGFFTGERPFLNIVDYEEGDIAKSQDLKHGGIYSQGNWKELVEYFQYASKKDNPRCLYIGDNLLQDIYVPNAYVQCDTIVMSEELMSEGMMYQGLVHPDDKILNSKLWGSYFYFKDSHTHIDSFWGNIIKKHSKLCVPGIDVLVQHAFDEPYKCFNGKNYSGYYPAMPLSMSGL